MSGARYAFLPLSEDAFSLDAVFELYDAGNHLVTFCRKTIRENLRVVGRGENWIGSILRLFSKKYPLKYSYPTQQRSICDRIGEDKLVDYLRSKGFRVVKNLDISDREIINYLENRGFFVEGLLNDSYYRSPLLVYGEEILDK